MYEYNYGAGGITTITVNNYYWQSFDYGASAVKNVYCPDITLSITPDQDQALSEAMTIGSSTSVAKFDVTDTQASGQRFFTYNATVSTFTTNSTTFSLYNVTTQLTLNFCKLAEFSLTDVFTSSSTIIGKYENDWVIEVNNLNAVDRTLSLTVINDNPEVCGGVTGSMSYTNSTHEPWFTFSQVSDLTFELAATV